MKLLAFSDLHRDEAAARRLVERATEVDLVVGAGDYANQHRGLEEAIGWLEEITTPTLLVPGNNETDEALRDACSGWKEASVLHGESIEAEGIDFYGLGAGIPTTPWGWSFDLDDEQASERLAGAPEGGVLILHSPPKGHCDRSGGGESLGSPALAAAIERLQPQLAVCGHIHESWGERSRIGGTEIANLGPEGDIFEL
ncbi:MAG: metallophosphoesterase family protein [Solirubrobacterales bacterium]